MLQLEFGLEETTEECQKLHHIARKQKGIIQKRNQRILDLANTQFNSSKNIPRGASYSPAPEVQVNVIGKMVHALPIIYFGCMVTLSIHTSHKSHLGVNPCVMHGVHTMEVR